MNDMIHNDVQKRKLSTLSCYRVMAVVVLIGVVAGCSQQTPEEEVLADVDAPELEVSPEVFKAVDESMIDALGPELPENAGKQLKQAIERERDLMRQLMAVDQHIGRLIQEQTKTDPETQAMQQRMVEAREAYQAHVYALPKVENLVKQKNVLRKHLEAAQAVRRKLSPKE